MSDLEARIAEAVNAHTTSAFAGSDTACSCDRTWRRNADHCKHVSESLTTMLAPVIRDREAEAWEQGVEDLAYYGGVIPDNPYRRSNDE